MTSDYPELPSAGNAETEQSGVSLVRLITFRSREKNGLGCIYRIQAEADPGIDGILEILELVNGTKVFTGRLLGVQIKTGPSYFREETGDGWLVPVPLKSVHYWREYALPVIVVLVDPEREEAYWGLGSTGEFARTKTTYKVPIPRAQRFDGSSADRLAALAAQGTPALFAQLQRLAAEMSDTVAAELDRHRAAWRDGHRRETRAWLDAMTTTSGRLALLDDAVASPVLRFAAAVALDDRGDVDAARAWAAEARRRDPDADDGRLRAAILRYDGELDAALSILSNASTVSEQLALIGMYLAAGRVKDAAGVLESISPTAMPDLADAHRYRAHIHMANGDLAAAQVAVATAMTAVPTCVYARQLRGMLDYLEGLTPAARDGVIAPWPRMVPQDALRGDPQAMRALERSCEDFRELLLLDWTAKERRHLETWQLAALCAIPHRRTAAADFARTVLARDRSHPYVLYWTIAEALLRSNESDVLSHVGALQSEVERTEDLDDVVVYLGLRHGMGDGASCGDWLEEWQDRFARANELETWTVWRVRTYLAANDQEAARALLATVNPMMAHALEGEFLAREAERSGDATALLAYRATEARSHDDFQHLFLACNACAQANAWALGLPLATRYFELAPTARVRWLALVMHHNMLEIEWCQPVLDAALSAPDIRDDPVLLHRMRADVRLRLGDAQGALEDLRRFIGIDETSETTRDLFLQARALVYVGRTPELLACAHALSLRPDLPAREALSLAEVLVHDDARLARTLWTRANALGIADVDVPNALVVGFQLGLDAQLGPLHARMTQLAATGAKNVRAFTIDELLAHQRTWQAQRDQFFRQYQIGEMGTHLLAEFLGAPLVRFYHAIPAATESAPLLRHRFPLQLRDGRRGAPQPLEAPAPGRLAMDVSALLLAAHLGMLDAVEAQFAPIYLSPNTLIALRAQRDRTKPHQPSQLLVNRALLKAEQQRKVQVWRGELPALDPDTAAQAKRWQSWLALLERAYRERAFVLDLPLDGDELPHGRPSSMAGAGRLATLVTVEMVRALLISIGAWVADDASVGIATHLVAARLGEDSIAGTDDSSTEPLTESAGEGTIDSASAVATVDGDVAPCNAVNDVGDSDLPTGAPPSSIAPTRTPGTAPFNPTSESQLKRGSVVYLTASGAEALVAAGLLDAAAMVLALRVDASDQATRRATEESVDEFDATAEWLNDLMRRVSDGLETGRYAVLPKLRDHDADDADRHSRECDENADDDLARKTSDFGASDEKVDSQENVRPRRTNNSLALQTLADVAGLPPDTVEAVWLDDRWIGRHAFIGRARIVDVLTVAATLEAKGQLAAAQRWHIHHRLRSANVRVLPLMAEDILYHLRQAPIRDGVVLETPALRVLRQYVAVVTSDAAMLRIPNADQLSSGDIGDLEVLRGYTAAVRESIAALWRGVRGQSNPRALADVEARSEWIVENLYVDLGVLRAHLLRASSLQSAAESTGPAEVATLATSDASVANAAQHATDGASGPVDAPASQSAGAARTNRPLAQPEPSISGLDGAAFLLAAAELVLPQFRRVSEDDLASAYTQWIYTTMLETRMGNDAQYRDGVLSHLRRLLATWPEQHTEGSDEYAMARVVAGWIFDAMPSAVRDALESDTLLMDLLGRSATVVLTIGQRNVRIRDFAVAVAELFGSQRVGQATITLPETAFSDATSAVKRAQSAESQPHTAANTGEAPTDDSSERTSTPRPESFEVSLPVLETEPVEHIFLSLGPDHEMVVRSVDESERVRIEPWVIGVLSPDVETRAETMKSLRSDLDLDAQTFARLLRDVIDENDASVRFERVWRTRARASQRHYGALKRRWRRVQSIHETDLVAPSQCAVLQHLRMAPTETATAPPSNLGCSFVSRWEHAGRTLVAEIGITEAYNRLATLPVPLPESLMEAVRAMPSDDQRRFVHGLLRTAPSPVSAVHLLRLLAVLGDDTPAYQRLATRVFRKATAPEVVAQWQLCRAVADHAYRDARHRVEDSPECDTIVRATDGSGAESMSAPNGDRSDDGNALLLAWHHSHHFLAALTALNWSATELLTWVQERTARKMRPLFTQRTKSLRDVAVPEGLSVVRAVAGALQYVIRGTSTFAASAEVNRVLRTLFTKQGAGTPIPHIDLFRDLDAQDNVLGSWLRPKRSVDGGLAIGEFEAVPSALAPAQLTAVALQQLAASPNETEGWIMLESVLGPDVLSGGDAVAFAAAAISLDLAALKQTFHGFAGVVVRRISRQAAAASDPTLRVALRAALLAARHDNTPSEQSMRGDALSIPEAADEANAEWRAVAIDGLYLLAQAEENEVAAMERFSEDLIALGRNDDSYLRDIRGVLERMVRDRPLVEAVVSLPLLAEARGAA